MTTNDKRNDRAALIRARSAKPVPIPKTVMTGVFWSFHEPRYPNLATFVEAAAEYNVEMNGTWEPDLVVVPVAAIRVACDDSGTDAVALSTSQRGFTVAELLYQLHTRLRRSLADADHHFFEGLELHDETPPPLYIVTLGS